MHNATQHVSAIELEQGLPEVLASPTDAGHLTAIFVRPAPNERRTLDSATLTLEGGIDGDRWVHDSYYRLKDGTLGSPLPGLDHERPIPAASRRRQRRHVPRGRQLDR